MADGGEKYSEAVRAYLPDFSGRIDEVTAARARQLAEKPAVATAEDIRRFRAAIEAERVRRKAAANQLNRDLLLALLEEERSQRP